MPVPALTPETRADIEDLITAFFYNLDRGDIDAAADMFAEEAPMDMGVAERPLVHGPAGVRAMFGSRPENRVVRHQWSNLHVRSGGEKVDAIFQFVTYVGAADSVAPPTAVTIGDVEVQLVQRAYRGGWEFAAMNRTVVFAPQNS